jgi:hypothetical protein
MLTRQGASLLPWFGGDRPVRPWRTGSAPRGSVRHGSAVFHEGPPGARDERP